MYLRISTWLGLCCLALPWLPASAAAADLAAELARCLEEPDDARRLACYDALARRPPEAAPAEAVQRAGQALDTEFTFSSRAWRDGPLGFRIPVDGVYSEANRAAAFPMPEVASAAGKIRRALTEFETWHLRVSVHPSTAAFGRSTPYTGEELKTQAENALSRAPLDADRFTVEVGEPVERGLSTVDVRREGNAIVRIVIEGLR